VEPEIEFLSDEKNPGVDMTPHLKVVGHGQIADDVVLPVALDFEIVEDIREDFLSGKNVVQDKTVFESAVHSLTEEGYHGMGCISD